MCIFLFSLTCIQMSELQALLLLFINGVTPRRSLKPMDVISMRPWNGRTITRNFIISRLRLELDVCHHKAV